MNKKIVVHIMHKSITTSTGIHALLSKHGDFIVEIAEIGQTDFSAVDVAVVDYDGGIDLMAVLSNTPDIALKVAPKVLIVTERIKEWDIRSALDVGIRGFLGHDCNADELARAIRRLDEGKVYLSESVEVLAQRSMGRSRLTARERQVLQLLGQGFCNKLIARALGIAEITAKIHMQSLMEKLEATTRTHAVAIAMELGLMRAHAEATVSMAAQQRRIKTPSMNGQRRSL